MKVPSIFTKALAIAILAGVILPITACGKTAKKELRVISGTDAYFSTKSTDILQTEYAGD